MKRIDWDVMASRREQPPISVGASPNEVLDWPVVKVRDWDTYQCGCPLGRGVIRAPTVEQARRALTVLRAAKCAFHDFRIQRDEEPVPPLWRQS